MAHAQVVGLVPGLGVLRRHQSRFLSHTDISLSVSLSLSALPFLPLKSINLSSSEDFILACAPDSAHLCLLLPNTDGCGFVVRLKHPYL